jgi:hypothetical protein
MAPMLTEPTEIQTQRATQHSGETSMPRILALQCHPDTACPAVESLEASAAFDAHGALHLRFVLRAQPAALRIPPVVQPGAADGLWEHTCFEAFLARAEQPAYREFNFSPSGQWAVYAFSGWRERDAGFVAPVAPMLSCTHHADGLEMQITLAPALLPALRPDTTLELGLTAVIEAADGTRSYWALTHGDGKPDFHRRDTFALALLPAPSA